MFSPSSLIGRTLGGQYRIDALLGQGGFGAVFRALDLQLSRPVAVKVVAHAAADGLDGRFRREAQLQARLRHPAIVRLLHFGEENGLCFMVQEFVDGNTLRSIVDTQGPLSAARAVRVFGSLLEALDEAHAEGVVHRDLKPENIMLVNGRRGEEARLLDFGIAKIFENSEAFEALTTSGMVIGTPAWMAPEQARREPITPATDVYSLGCVMHYALTGRKPFVGTPVQVIMDHVTTPPPPLPENLPAELVWTVLRAMAKEPSDRFGSALDMRGALSSVSATEDAIPSSTAIVPIPSGSKTNLEPTPLGISNIANYPDEEPSSPKMIGAFTAAVLVVIGAGSVWLASSSSVPEAASPPRLGTVTPAIARAAESHDVAANDERLRDINEPEDPPRTALMGQAFEGRLAQPDAYLGAEVPGVAITLAPPPSEKTQPSRRPPPRPMFPAEKPTPSTARAVPGESTPSRAGRAPRTARREPKVVVESRRAVSNAADRGARSAQQGDFPQVLLEQKLTGQLNQCHCSLARKSVRRLAAVGVDRQGHWAEVCGRGERGGSLSKCAAALDRRLEAAMAQCPCHDDETRKIISKLKGDFGVDREDKWKARCVTPLPGSCLQP